MGTPLMDSHHVHSFWGLSPALDLMEVYAAAQLRVADEHKVKADGKEVNRSILQVAPCDCRHTATTIARSWRRAPEKVAVTVWEPSPEGLARHMLLLSILLDTQLIARDRVETFLEVHGNAKLRERTAEYMEAKGNHLADVVLGAANKEEVGELGRLFDLSQLKFKERDDLVEIFRGYSRKVRYDMDAAWDWRKRKFYGNRYDYVKNLVDWDYHMRLLPYEGSIVYFPHFRQWRSEGIAYDIRDSVFIEPNRSLISTAEGRTVEYQDRLMMDRGRSVTTRGLYCDIQASPYLSFGIDSEEKRLFKTASKVHLKSSQDIAEFNVFASQEELFYNQRYKLHLENDDRPEGTLPGR
ncbi:hypothetical protein CYMTET_50204 [Cymbomonas tetramitiformis]|uniref:Uncharacterized protein n=1 Tax=Cymbomonas tetramitiformis TaxID=36881 RepID=A0AAE0BNJ2_9CHLO|nr:hypothetical protein CYMTET_50204 [Cymbomonas tetramitiformis]